MKYVQTETSRHGKVVYYFRRGPNPRLRLKGSPGSKEFEASYEAAMQETPILHVRDMPQLPEARKQATERYFRQFMPRAQRRCRRKGLPFDLTMDWALQQAEAQGFRCCLTGIEFFAKHPGRSARNPYAPSVDKIDPRGGYTQANVRIVVFAVNAMLMDWGPEVFEQVVNSYRYTRTKKRLLFPHFLGSAGRDQISEGKSNA